MNIIYIIPVLTVLWKLVEWKVQMFPIFNFWAIISTSNI